MCAFKKPTEKGVREAIEFGWSEEDAKRGYTIFNYDGFGLLEIEVIGDCYNDSGYCDDEEAAHEAERSGFCKIIPVDELPETFEANGHTVRWFGWVDTPENRKAIENYAGRKHNVTFTVEMVFRKAIEFEIDESEYQELITGDGSNVELKYGTMAFEQLHNEVEKHRGYYNNAEYDYDSDYAVTDENGSTIIDWDN